MASAVARNNGIIQAYIRNVPVATYGAETWTLPVTEENALRMFERKIIRRIYGPVIENNVWRLRYNVELNTLLKGEDIVKFIKMVGACRENGRQCSAEENVKRKSVLQKKDRKTQDVMARLC
jgi:hypothetical protein